MTLSHSKKILVVDGDPEVSRQIAAWLKGEGVQILAALDGESGFMRFKKEMPDAVVISAQLDKVVGSVLCQRIKKNPATASAFVVLVSDKYSSHPELGKRAVSMFGADAYLPKPLEREAVIGIFKPLLKGIEELPATPKVSVTPPKEEKAVDASPPDAPIEKLLEAPSLISESSYKPPVLQGNLHDTPLPILLVKLFELKRTGVLILERNRIKREIFFKDGEAIHASSALRTENPALMLVRDHIISEEEYSKSLLTMTERGLTLNEALVECSNLTYEALYDHFRRYGREIIINSFAWHEGHFEFRPADKLPENIPSFDYRLLTLIYEGVGKYYPLKLFSSPIHEHKEEYPWRTPRFAELIQKIDLEPEKLKFTLLIDGKTPVRELVTLGREDLYGTYRLLWLLDLTKMIDFSDDPKPVGDAEFLPQSVKLEGEKKPLPQEILSSIMREYYRIKSSNYFHVLKVTPQANEDEIRRAYFELESKIHPDNLAEYDLKPVADKLNEILEKARAAQRILLDPRMKREYCHYLEIQERQRAKDEALQAEIAFKEGEKALKKADWEKAKERFETAIRLKPDEPDYYAYLGWTLFQTARGKKGAYAMVKRAKQELGKAISMNPNSDKAYLILGRVYAGEGNIALAEEHFQKALKINPECVPAKAALELLAKGKETAAAGSSDPEAGP